MQKFLISALALILVVGTLSTFFPADEADAQVFFANTRIGRADFDHSTVGTSAQDAIAPANVGANVLSWAVCADSANANYVAVSQNADPDTDGIRLGAEQCYTCSNCTASLLKSLKVKGGAAAQGYSVLQWRQQ